MAANLTALTSALVAAINANRTADIASATDTAMTAVANGYYNKGEVDQVKSDLQDEIDSDVAAATSTTLANVAENYYNKTEVATMTDTLVQDISTATDTVLTTVATNYYNKTEVYTKTETEDKITDGIGAEIETLTQAVQGGGNITGAIFKSSSPFFSDDSDTFTAAVNALTDNESYVSFQVHDALASTWGASIDISEWKTVNSLTNLVNMMNDQVRTSTSNVGYEKVANGIVGFNTVGYTGNRMRISGHGTDGMAIVNSLFENKIEVEGFTASYYSDTGEASITIEES